MCFGGGGSSSKKKKTPTQPTQPTQPTEPTTPTQPPTPPPEPKVVQWWAWRRQNNLDNPFIELNEDATNEKKNAKRVGTRSLQVPLTRNRNSGLGIPSNRR